LMAQQGDDSAVEQPRADHPGSISVDGAPTTTALNTGPEVAESDATKSPQEPLKGAAGEGRSPSRRRGKRRRSPPKRSRGNAKSRAAAQAAKFPRHSVERALRIPRAIYEQNGGKPATLQEAVRFTGGTSVSGPFRTEVSSGKKYGYLEPAENGKVGLTDRARRAIAPQSENDRLHAYREAILAAPDISDVYNFYRGENLPDQQFFVNALTDRFGVPADKVGEFLEIFNDSVATAQLIDGSGERPRLLDVGRDQEHRQKAPTAPAKRAVSSGTTCFVMQPFGGHLGGYFETIYKPAIEQAGLQALRADAEIFGAGKIMDQIWRGIRAADVLVAELTSKNPNVFYELGLAHALEKPVVLVSSNQEDVPFDLRHIRVILYDQTDPFWGQKLIDKLADKIQSALADPEESIFRIDEA
jgi:hypothetical protein